LIGRFFAPGPTAKPKRVHASYFPITFSLIGRLFSLLFDNIEQQHVGQVFWSLAHRTLSRHLEYEP